MRILGCILLIALACPATVVAQEKKEGKSGTNPVNFTYDFRFITEMQWFKDSGGSLVRHTLEYRARLGRDVANLKGESAGLFADMGKRFGVRMRAYYQNLSVNDPSSASFGSSNVSGIGDFDARILAIA